jgi:soluble cytochrome b562
VSQRYSVCFKCLSPQQKQEIEEYQEGRRQTIEDLDYADELLDDETYHSSPEE